MISPTIGGVTTIKLVSSEYLEHLGHEHDHDHEEHDEHDDHEDHEDHEHDHEEEHDEHGEGIDPEVFKIIMLVCMFLCVGFGVLPKVWGTCRNNGLLLSLLNCFSAGIFLAMSLIHIMPETAEIYVEWAAAEGIEEPFPLPYVMFFIGYLLILFVDRVAAKAFGAGHAHGGADSLNKPTNPDPVDLARTPSTDPLKEK